MQDRMNKIWNEEEILKNNIIKLFSTDLTPTTKKLHGFYEKINKQKREYEETKKHILTELQEEDLTINEFYKLLLGVVLVFKKKERLNDSCVNELTIKSNYVINKMEEAEPLLLDKKDKYTNQLEVAKNFKLNF